MNINRTIIVTAASAQLARSIAAALSAGGVGMFETALYTGNTLTHYISSGQIDAAFDAVLQSADALFQATNGNITMAQCRELIDTSIVANCDIENAEATCARLGLLYCF